MLYSRGGLAQDRHIKFGVGQQPLQPRVLLFQFLEPLRLIRAQAAEFLPPPVIRLLRYSNLLRYLLVIVCEEPDMKKIVVADCVVSGDYVAVSLKPPNATLYHLENNPDGRLLEGDPSGNWKSLADVKAEKGDDFWRMKLRIPVVGEAEADPKHRVAGAKPTKEAPWFFNVGRLRLAGLDAPEQQALSPTGGSWHLPAKFGEPEIQ